MKTQIKIVILAILALTVQGYSQQAVPAAGGTVNGTSGSFSFTVGQAASGYFKNSSNSMTVGVQQTYASYITQVQPAQCATVLANLDTAILADTIVGAQKYRFEVSNGNAIRTIESVTNSFTLAQLDGGACFNTVYAIRVAVQYGGIWYDYGTSCTVTTPNIAPTAQPQTFCASVTVANLVATGSTIQWYASANEGAALPTSTVLETGIYYASQTINGCESTRTAVTVTISPQVTPTFTQIASTCSGSNLTALPTTSNNGITGTWSPVLNNNQTTTYTFTPDAGQCAATTSQTITITTPKVTSPISFLAPTTTVAALPNVTIGTQIWTSKNLDLSTYRDGTPIPQVTDPTQWENITTGAWCYYDNNPANGEVYGKLYNWYAVAGIYDNDPNTPNKTLAPTGWHVGSDNEWNTLSAFLGGESVASGKMKVTGTEFWASPNSDATNSSGFSGLPGGYRFNQGPFNFINEFGIWWSSSETSTTDAWGRSLNYGGSGNDNAGSGSANKAFGGSVRLIKD